MKFIKKLSAFIMFGLIMASYSQAYTLTSSGTWVSGEVKDGGQPSGIGSNTISWGTTSSKYPTQSSYVFNGVTVDPLDPADMVWDIGTFTHNNYPIFNPALIEASLGVDIDIFDGSNNVYSNYFVFDFTHNETPNRPSSGVCKATGHTTIPDGGCPDVVTLTSKHDNSFVKLGDKTYALDVYGFSQSPDSNPDKRFVTYEKQANSTHLYAKLERVQVPEIDGNSAGLAVGLMLGLVLLMREKGLLTA